MKENLNIYKEGDKIIIEDDLEEIELPYTDELWRRLDGERTYDEDSGWLIDGIELSTIISDESEKETENMFIGTIQAEGIDDRRELHVVKDGDVYKIIGIDSDNSLVDTEIVSDTLQEAIQKTREFWSDEDSDLQLSDEANQLLKEMKLQEK